ncbi:S49 family peptidase [Methylolobus aquaticus]
MMRYPQIAARLFNTPLMVHPAKLDAIIAGLSGRIWPDAQGLVPSAPVDALEPSAFTSRPGSMAGAELQTYPYRVIDGVAVLDIMGVLAHHGRLQGLSSYVAGYGDFAQQLDAALADTDVRGIVLNIDSPGGEVAGAFDLAAKIKAARSIKPIAAVMADLSASAAYLIASAAESRAITQTGYAGSIGVVMRHVDFSQALSNEGIRVTHIFAGAQKIDGNPYAELPVAVRDRFQAEINDLYGLFVETVAANTGLDPLAIRGTEAGMYRGAEAVRVGLADRVATPDEVIADMAQQVSKRAAAVRITNPRSQSMNEPTQDGGRSQADVDQAHATGVQQGRAEGSATERARIAAILTHTEAEGRSAQAQTLALETDLTAEQAGKVLAASPKVQPAASADNPFLTAMAAVANPTVGADLSAAEGGSEGAVDEAARVIAFLPKRTIR